MDFYFKDADIEQCKNILKSVDEINGELDLVDDPSVLEERVKSDLGLQSVGDLKFRLANL